MHAIHVAASVGELADTKRLVQHGWIRMTEAGGNILINLFATLHSCVVVVAAYFCVVSQKIGRRCASPGAGAQTVTRVFKSGKLIAHEFIELYDGKRRRNSALDDDQAVRGG